MYRCLVGAVCAMAVSLCVGEAQGGFLAPFEAEVGFDAELQRAGMDPISVSVSEPGSTSVPGILEPEAARALSGGMGNDHEVVSRAELNATQRAVWGALHFESVVSIALTTEIETRWYGETSVMADITGDRVFALSGEVLRPDRSSAEFSAGVRLTPVAREGEAIERPIAVNEIGEFSDTFAVPAGEYRVVVWSELSHDRTTDGAAERSTSMLFTLIVPTPGTLALVGMSSLLILRRSR